MAAEPAPAFQFYVKDWRSSRKVQTMTFAERGMYLEMLLEQWETGSVPSTPAALASLLGGTEAAWTRAWPKLILCFKARARDGRFVNEKLEAVRRAKAKFAKALSESGLRGAEARWKRYGEAMARPSKANGVSMAKNGSSTSTSISTSTSSSTNNSTSSSLSPFPCFERFWAAYPRKTAKATALKEWLRIQPPPDDAVTDAMIVKVHEQRTSTQWLKDGGQFIPHARTWLHQQRWKDEPDDVPPPLTQRTINVLRGLQ